MRRSATQLSRAVVVLLAFALVGCGSSTSPATSPAPGGAGPTTTGQAAQSTGPSSAGGGGGQGAFPTPDLPDSEQSTFLAAANAELDLRRRMRDEIYVADVIGNDGAAVITDIEGAEKAFGEAAMADFVTKTGIDLSASIDVSRPLAMTGDQPPFEWSGSLFGYTSFMTSTWLGFAPQAIQNLAGEAKFRSQTIEKTETHDSTIGSLKEHLVLTEKVTIGAGEGRLVFDVTLESAAVLTEAATGTEVAKRSSTGTGHFEVNACPDDKGVAEGTYTLVDKEEVTNAAGTSNGGTASTDATFRLLDGDDAHLIHTEAEANLDAKAHGAKPAGNGGAGEPFDWDASATFKITIPAAGKTTYDAITNVASTDGTTAKLGYVGWLLAAADHYLAEAAREAEKFWRSGKCIELKPSEESRKVKPNEQVSLTVDSTHKWDKRPVTAPIKAAFNGQTSLSPTDAPQPPPASFTFVAGPKQGDKGTIDLTQTGVRGIGKKTVEFTVAGSLHFGGTIHYEEVQQYGHRTNRLSGTAEVVLLVDPISWKLTAEPDGGSTYSYDWDATAGNRVGARLQRRVTLPACKSHGTGTLVDLGQFKQPPQGVLIAHGVLGDDILQLQIGFMLSCGGKNLGPFPLRCTGVTDGLKAKFDGVANYRIDCSYEYDNTNYGAAKKPFLDKGRGHVEGVLSPLDGPFPTRGP